MLTLMKAIPTDAEALTELSVRSFSTDKKIGGSAVEGPPCYDSVAWHSQCINSGWVYTVCLDEKLIGGAILLPDENEATALNIGRIFLDPTVFRQGYGLALMKLIEDTFSTVSAWTLDTPIWNERTNHFYQKLGYQKTGENKWLNFYRKENTALQKGKES